MLLLQFLFLCVDCSLGSRSVLCWLDNIVCPRARVLQLSGLSQLSSCSPLAGCSPELKNVVLIYFCLFLYPVWQLMLYTYYVPIIDNGKLV